MKDLIYIIILDFIAIALYFIWKRYREKPEKKKDKKGLGKKGKLGG